MDKRIKYSFKQKLSVVLGVTAGKTSVCSAANKIGANEKPVRRWVNLYKQFGKEGLKLRHGSYSGQFKIKVIKYMLKNHLSLTQTAALFGVPQDSTVGCWFKKYESQGVEGLLKETRGRKKSIMAEKKTKTPKLSSNPIDGKLAALQAENEYLRAENAFLKKLDALILEEKAAKKQSRQQKPSKN
jgi:transposase